MEVSGTRPLSLSDALRNPVPSPPESHIEISRVKSEAASANCAPTSRRRSSVINPQQRPPFRLPPVAFRRAGLNRCSSALSPFGRNYSSLGLGNSQRLRRSVFAYGPPKAKDPPSGEAPAGSFGCLFERRGVGGMGIPLKSTRTSYRDRPNVEVTEVTKRPISGKEPKWIRRAT